MNTYSIEQSLLHGARIRPIKVYDVQESLLTKDLLAEILAATSSSTKIGIASSYSRKGTLCVLAFAATTSVLLLRLSSSKNRSENPSPLLQQFFMDHIFYTFDAHTLALSLHNDLHLGISSVSDIQSSVPAISNRNIYQTVLLLLEGTKFHVYEDNFLAIFKNNIWEDKSATSFAQRAWISHFVTTIEEVLPKLIIIPIINTNEWSDEDLDFLSVTSRDAMYLVNMRPQVTKHDFSKSFLKEDGKLEVVSSRYQSRIQGSGHQKVKVKLSTESGQSIFLTSNTAKVNGKRAIFSLPGGLGNRDIQSITSIGDSGPTQAELSHSILLLDTLQGKRLLFQNAWIQLFKNPLKTSDILDTTFGSFDPWQLSSSNSVYKSSFLSSENSKLLATPPLLFDFNLNQSQINAVNAMLDHKSIQDYTLVQGPPGTGKTTVIAAFVNSILLGSNRSIWLSGKSNIAVKNIAEKLYKSQIRKWKLIISKEFYIGWHSHIYKDIPSENIILSDQLSSISLKHCRIVLCTLSMFATTKLQALTKQIPFETFVVDEASQIQMGDYYPILSKLGGDLKKMCFIGDNKQLPPFGETDDYKLKSIFERSDLNKNTFLLNIQYRMPIAIGNFISEHVYNGQLLSDINHPIQSKESCQFINIEDGQEEFGDTSYKNMKEVEAVVKIARQLCETNKNYKIITPYDLQRNEIENALRTHAMDWEDKCFNVDSFQGNEEDYIIISVVRTNEIGFLKDERRSNVMLTRSKRGMYICSSARFLETVAKDTLMGRIAAEWSDRTWIEWSDVQSGNFYL